MRVAVRVLHSCAFINYANRSKRAFKKVLQYLFMRLNIACITNILCRDNIYADTNLYDRRLTRICIVHINKTRAEKCRFTVCSSIDRGPARHVDISWECPIRYVHAQLISSGIIYIGACFSIGGVVKLLHACFAHVANQSV